MLRDLRYALRQLVKSPGFTVTVVLMLALGIGANTAVFSVMNAILLQLLPVSHPEALVFVRMANGQSQPPGAGNTGSDDTSFSLPVFEALRQRHDVFDDLIANAPLSLSGSVAVRHGALPEEAEGEEVSGNFFSGLGARLDRGRGFTLDDETGHTPVAVISYDYWTRSYARDPGVVGQTIYVKSVPMTVVGVAAQGFKGIDPGVSRDFWIPLQNRVELNAWGMPSKPGSTVNELYSKPKWWSLRMMARMHQGVTPSQAQQALTGPFAEVVHQTVGNVDPKQWKPVLDFVPAKGMGTGSDDYRQPVRILMGLVGMVLLIACTNVAMMVQARNVVRQREFSLRLAVGARHSSIFRQLLCESLILVGAGSALGWLFALAATRALADWSEIETGLSPDSRVLFFTLLISSSAALIFGLVPLWSAMRAPVAGVLRASSNNTTANRSRVLGARILLSAQVAVCLVLLMAAGLLLRTLGNYANQKLGMRAESLLVFGVTPQGHVDSHAFYRSLLDRIGRIPGVESVSMVENRPGSGWSNNNGLVLDGVERPDILRSNGVGPAFFQTMGIPILAGRDISLSDTEKTPFVVIVNESFVKKYLPNTNPLGHVLGDADQKFTIIGVVQDSKYTGVDEEVMPMAYSAPMQFPSIGTMHMEVRTRGDAVALLPDLRKAVAELYPNVPLEKPMTQKAQFEKSYEQQRMFAAMGGFFGVLAAFLVATGLYGTHAFRVSRRTTEIGVRMALGASRGRVLGMVMMESMWVLAAGLVAGIPLCIFALRPLKSMLYQMSPLDPFSFTVAIFGMILVAGCAALVPARRAASIEPMQALRAD